MSRTKYIQKYLANYSEFDLQKIDFNIFPEYERLAVMPAYSEGLGLQDTLESAAFAALSAQKKTLLIIVINEKVSSHEDDHRNNLLSWNFLSKQGDTIYKDGEKYWMLLNKNSYFDCLVLNHFQAPFQFLDHEGVGKARKIGFDLALKLFADSKLNYPWVYSIDADTTLPLDYFSCDLTNPTFIVHQTQLGQKTGAYVLNFQHKSASLDLQAAVNRYEKYLYDLFENLRKINSPYAYISIGSAMVVSLEHYAKVRGMPKRLAGEDFHLLNKIAKISSITSLSKPSVSIAARISQRTPFGTGQALLADINAENPEKYNKFNETGYKLLQSILRICEYSISHTELNLKKTYIKLGSTLQLSSSELNRIYQAIEIYKIDNMLKVATSSSNSLQQQKRSFDVQFDALKTFQILKFLSSTTNETAFNHEI